MKVCSNSSLTLSEIDLSIGSRSALAEVPPRSSSQFPDHLMSMRSPVSRDFGGAVGMCSCSGAESRLSYSRSEERRVGKECRCRWGREQEIKKKTRGGKEKRIDDK